MYKQTINNITLQLVMQQGEVMNYPSSSHAGVLSRDHEGFRFEEAVKQITEAVICPRPMDR